MFLNNHQEKSNQKAMGLFFGGKDNERSFPLAQDKFRTYPIGIFLEYTPPVFCRIEIKSGQKYLVAEFG